MYRFKSFRFISTVALATTIIGCSSNSTLPQATTRASLTTDVNQYQYLIGPGDTLLSSCGGTPKYQASL